MQATLYSVLTPLAVLILDSFFRKLIAAGSYTPAQVAALFGVLVLMEICGFSLSLTSLVAGTKLRSWKVIACAFLGVLVNGVIVTL
jgi:hypothetical protein